MKLFRKRLIPEEIIELKEDRIVFAGERQLVTVWNVIRPRTDFTHGCSCYFLEEGFKVSQFLREDGSLKCWYCDIVACERTEQGDGYIFTDLLADVVIEENGMVQVVDLDELSQAFENGLIGREELVCALRQLDGLLKKIYSGEFAACQRFLEERTKGAF